MSWNWYGVKDGNMQVREMLNRHYSANRYRDGRKVRLSAGPGEKMILLTPDQRACFIWRKFIDKSGQQGINCALFRNEAPDLYLSSDLHGRDGYYRQWAEEQERQEQERREQERQQERDN